MILTKTFLDIIREQAVKGIKELSKQFESFKPKLSASFQDKSEYYKMMVLFNARMKEVDNLYYLYLLEDKTISYNKTEAFLNTIVNDFLKSVDYIDKSGVHFETNIDESYRISTDSRKLKLVLENILLKILRAADSAKITFRTKEAHNDLLLEIIDYGKGMPEKDLEAFKSVPDIDRRDFQNLDLFVSYKILTEQGDGFSVEKTPEHIRYVITFHQVKETREGAGKKILIVDDDIEFIRLIQLFQHKFSKIGYEVEYKTNAKDGLNRAKEILPDLILLDLMLPDSTGLQVCEEIRKYNKSVRIIMLTAYGSALDEKKAYELGVNYFMNKSYNFKDILDQIQKFI